MSVNQLKAGAFLSYLSIGLNNIIGLIYTPFMLRMMGQSEYGLYSLVASIVAYLTVLDLGFGNAIVRYTAKFRAEGKEQEQYEMFGMFLILYSIIGIIAFLIGLGLYFNVDRFFNATMDTTELYKIRVMMLLMIANLAVTFPMSIWGAIITAYENFVFQKLINIIRIILNPLVMVFMLYMGYRAIGMVVVTTLFNIVTLVIYWWYCNHKLKIKVVVGKFRYGFMKEISIYSFWIFLNSIMDRIYWGTGQFILGIYSGAAAVAVFAVAIQLQQIYMAFSSAISGVFLPKITAMFTKNNDMKEISSLFIRTGRIQYIVMAFILTGFILFGKSFVSLWAGVDYVDAYWIAICFFVPLTVPLIQNLGITILQARNQMKFRSLLYVLIAILSLIISIPLSKMYGGVGCAIGIALALVLGQIIVMNIYYYMRVDIDIILFWKEIAKMSITPLIVGGGCFIFLKNIEIITALELAFYIMIFAIIYLPAFWFVSMNSYEKKIFSSSIKKIIYYIGR